MNNSFLRGNTVVKNLIIINALFWLGSIVLLQKGIRIEEYLGLHYFMASDFKIWQFVTYMFLHSYPSLDHVFFNMFGLFMFGRILEQVWGPKRFLIYYIVTGVGAALVQQIVQYIDFISFNKEIANLIQNFPQEGVNVGESLITSRDALMVYRNSIFNSFITIGASGAVFGILLAFGMMFPNTRIMLLIPPIPIKAKYFVIIYGVLELFLGIRGGSNVAHFAHLGGMLFGIILIKYWNKNRNYFY